MKIIFWNVDTRYDFMRRDGKLYVQDAENIEDRLYELTDMAERRNIQVVNTADWHTAESEELSEKPDFANTFPEHCMRNTKGAEYIPATNPKNPYIIDWKQDSFNVGKMFNRRNLVLYKDKFDVFAGTPFSEKIVDLVKPQIAIVYGVATNVCVDCAVRGLLERKVCVYVPIDAIKELPRLSLPYENWKREGAILTTTDDVYKLLGERR